MTSEEWLQVGWSLLAALGGPSALWAAGRWIYTQHGLQARIAALDARIEELHERIDEEQKAREATLRDVAEEMNDALVQQARIAGRIDAADVHRRWLQAQSQRLSAKLHAVRTPPAPRPAPPSPAPEDESPLAGRYQLTSPRKPKR